MNRLAWMTISGMLFAAGCTSVATRSSGWGGAVTPERIYETVEAQHRTIMSMEGNGNISVQTPELAQSGSFELLLKKPDSLLLKFEGPFGIDVGAALLSRREFQFYDIFQNRVIVGETTPANLQRVFRIGVTFDDLLALVSGGAFLSTDDPSEGALERTEDSYVLTFPSGRLSRQYLIDPVTLQITTIVFLGPDGSVAAEQRFADFRQVDGVLIPFELKVIQRSERRMVALRYDEIFLNRPDPEVRFTVPETARRVVLQ